MRRTALAGVVSLLALPSAVMAADTPTGGLDAATTSTAAPATPTAPAAPADEGPTPTRASAELAGAGTWSALPTKDPKRPVRVSGAFGTDLAGRSVNVERKTPAGRWQRATGARIRSTGRFAVTWKTSATRVHELRVVLAPESNAKAASAASTRATSDADAPSVRIAVLGRAKATWYGPGFYGKKTACGVTLQADTVGVANRTLPCGTQVEIRRGGKTVVAPVIDRGPFANDADFDLTKNVADQIGVDGVNPVSFVQRDDLPVVKTPSSAPAQR
ncbi:septal ring lytic transglycosylase RlpA family protein [Patulibacter minatonensis]|uniref:septal ring lytic transglycosylase RlpA family protein n=1 Tax=Patulibacter minatonensis TaxID=298163 RepID=UPI0004AF5E4C|nr:septal ring lytic transglycosylase RlpA family protein [Patulibacter minatonensis]